MIILVKSSTSKSPTWIQWLAAVKVGQSSRGLLYGLTTSIKIILNLFPSPLWHVGSQSHLWAHVYASTLIQYTPYVYILCMCMRTLFYVLPREMIQEEFGSFRRLQLSGSNILLSFCANITVSTSLWNINIDQYSNLIYILYIYIVSYIKYHIFI